ncbi:hypothetical protein [Sutcliffiella halmapala]|uniref:hypothetical protein n=1 Tax=Sutcliffiella halmapala TaxID=79882 RepID=UPI000995A16D|nr:hypothetical protein [Sutcliffiella halmapala]
MRLKEEEFMVLQQYNDLLETLEEAFTYLCKKADVHIDTSQQVKQDSYLAIARLVETHVKLADWFHDKEEALQIIAEFERIIDELEVLGHFDKSHIPEQVTFSTYVLPVFEEWKINMQKQLMPFLAH